MPSLKKLNLFHKFLLLTVLATTGFIIVGYSFEVLHDQQTATMAAHEKARDLSDLVRQIETGMAQARVSEKDFLINRSMQSIGQFDTTISATMQNVDTAMELAQSSAEKELAVALRLAFERYQANFQSMVSSWQILGLDHESGLHGGLRRTVHAVEETLKEQDEIHLSHSMLMMRRHEKDYMARKMTKYVDKMATEQQRFAALMTESALSDEAKTTITVQMSDYYSSFLEFPALDAKIAEARAFGDELVVSVEVAMNALVVERGKQLQTSAVLTEAKNARVTRNFFIALVSITIVVSALLMLMARSIVTPVRAASKVANSIAAGNLNNTIEIKSSDEVGQLMAALETMQSNLNERIAADRELAAVSGRIKQALDNVSGKVLVADVDHKIIYKNNAVAKFLNVSQAEICRDIPGFDAEQIIGSPIDQFYSSPAEQRSFFSSLKSEHTDEIKMGDLTVRMIASPVLGSDGERLGTVVEMTDRTLEIATEEEVQHVVESALAGDLSKRISLVGKSGFFGRLSDGVNQLVDVAEQVIDDTLRMFSSMASGDLTQTIENEYRGSFDELKRDANASVAKLTEVVGQIQNSSASVKTGAIEISQGNANLSQRTEEQASSLEETASSMEEMISTVKQNADNASQANMLAQSASKQAESGGAVVGEAVKAMAEINASSKKISDIIAVIDEIAFQTNLLALNAAVEAARAGDQGRGFAVVASEVRNLAGRSATAAKEIKDLIKDSGCKVEEGSRLVNESGETLQDIVTRVTEVTSIVGEIAFASQEQSSGIDEVNKAIAQIDELTQQNAALVEEAAAASESLGEQADDLDQMMMFFAVNADQASHAASPGGVERRSADRPWHATAVPDVGSQSESVPQQRVAANGDDIEWEEF